MKVLSRLQKTKKASSYAGLKDMDCKGSPKLL